MPCYECENGSWRFGETGGCDYSSKSECETANKDYYAAETYNDYPQAATNNAKRAIKKLEQIDSENKIKEDFESFFEEIIKSIKENK